MVLLVSLLAAVSIDCANGMSSPAARRVLVTGGNAGIGLALCTKLASEDNCMVYLGARSEEKGRAAVASLKQACPAAKVEFLHIDVTSVESVKRAAERVAAGGKLFALVNNAGIGLGTATDGDLHSVIETNYYGALKVSKEFVPLIEDGGKLVNLGSGAASGYVSKNVGVATEAERMKLASSDVTAADIEAIIAKEKQASYSNDGYCVYSLSKACLTAHTMIQARENPSLTVSVCSPGFIKTAMTAGFGAKLEPDKGTISIRHCLFDVPHEKTGWYWGSDAKRSPLHKPRDPGTPEWQPDE